MKCRKTVLAVAVAGIAATPMMASATTSLSGAVELRFAGADDGVGCAADTVATEDDEGETVFTSGNGGNVDGCIVNANGDVEDGDDLEIEAGDVIVGVNATQALNSGLTGYGNLRIDLDSTSGGTSFSADNVFVGFRGGFGDLRLGEVSNPGEFGQITDIVYDMGAGVDEGLGYTGSFGGATIGVSWSPAADQDLIAVGVRFNVGGFSFGAGVQDLDETTNSSISVGFAFAGASIGLGLSTIEDGFEATDGSVDDETIFALTLGYSIAGFSLGLNLQAADEIGGEAAQFNAGYDLGGGLGVSFRFNAFDDDQVASDTSDWRVQFAKSF